MTLRPYTSFLSSVPSILVVYLSTLESARGDETIELQNDRTTISWAYALRVIMWTQSLHWDYFGNQILLLRMYAVKAWWMWNRKDRGQERPVYKKELHQQL